MRQIARLTDEELNLSMLFNTYLGRGSIPHRPDLLLKLTIYEHSQGRVQPVQWQRADEDSRGQSDLCQAWLHRRTAIRRLEDPSRTPAIFGADPRAGRRPGRTGCARAQPRTLDKLRSRRSEPMK